MTENQTNTEYLELTEEEINDIPFNDLKEVFKSYKNNEKNIYEIPKNNKEIRSILNSGYLYLQNSTVLKEIPLIYVINNDKIKFTKVFIELGADVNKEDSRIDHENPLYCAIRRKNKEIIEKLIDSGANIDDVSFLYGGKSALHIAAEIKSNKLFEYLINRNIDINICDDNNKTVLDYAIGSKNIKLIELLIKNNANINLEDQDYIKNLVNIALEKDDISLIKLLIEKGIDINAKYLDNKTLLAHAIENNKKNLFKYLIKLQNINLDELDAENNTILHYLVNNKWDTKIILLFIIKYGINNINKQNSNGETILHLAAKTGDIKLFKHLVKKRRMNIELQNSNGENVAFIAAKTKNMELINYMLEKQILDINSLNSNRETLLHIAAKTKNIELINILMDNFNNINVNAIDRDGKTVLHSLMEQLTSEYEEETEKCINIAKYLIEKGADANIADNNHVTPIDYVIEAENKEMFNYLLTKLEDVNIHTYTGTTPLIHAIETDNHEMIEYLIKERNADVNYGDAEMNKPIHFAVEKMNKKLIKYLIKGCNVNINSQNDDHNSPLHVIVKEIEDIDNRINIIKNEKDENMNKEEIKELNLKLNKENKRFKDSKKIIKFLIKHGANINLRGEGNNTVLHIAAEGTSRRIFRYLMLNGADPELRNNDNKSPRDLVENSEDEGIKRFSSHGIDLFKNMHRIRESFNRNIFFEGIRNIANEIHNDIQEQRQNEQERLENGINEVNEIITPQQNEQVQTVG